MNDMSDIFEDELDEGCEFCGKKDCIGSAGTCDGLMESNNGEPLSKKDVICDCKLHYDYCPMPNNCPHNPKWVEVGRIKENILEIINEATMICGVDKSDYCWCTKLEKAIKVRFGGLQK